MPPIVPPAPLDLPAPAPPTRSLLRSARRLDGWPRVGAPVSFRPSCADGRVGIFDLCAADYDKVIPEAEATRTFYPFAAWAGDECDVRTWRRNDGELADRARAYLDAYKSAQIAAEFWQGTTAAAEGYDTDGHLWLAHDDVDELAAEGSAPGTITALGLLEVALGGCAGQGVIHASLDVVTLWTADGLLDLTQGGTLVTRAGGTLVITDAGYPGTGPGATGSAPAGLRWAYGTTQVLVAEGPVTLVPDPAGNTAWAQAMERSTNDIAWRAEQPFLVLWDGCCHAGVPIDITDRS